MSKIVDILNELFSKDYNFNYNKIQPANCKLVQNLLKYFNTKYNNIFICGAELLYCYLFKSKNINELLKEMYCYCGNKNTFKGLNKGYTKYCSNKCRANSKEYQEKQKISKLNNIDENGLNSYQRAKQKSKQTMLRKYGVDHNWKSKDPKLNGKYIKQLKYGNKFYNNKEKAKQTKLSNIDENGLNSYQRAIIKGKQTKKLRYNDENYNNIEKAKQTNIIKYGTKYTFQTENNKIKSKQTKKLRYNDENYNNIEKAKQTCLKRYNVDNYFKSQKHKIIMKSKQKEIQQKVYQTKKKNNSFNKSQQEEECYQLLLQKFNKDNIIRQYKSELYPFNCDFYIKSLDLYIECNFSQYHHGHPFNNNCNEDLLELEKLKNQNTKYYDNIIDTWTRRDIIKLNTFINNKLNYKIFYSKNEFKNWFNKLKI